MDDDASQAAGIAALGARDPASAAVRGFETVSKSQIRRRGLRRRRERVQTEDPRHRRRLRAPRAPQPQHQGGYGREGVTIDFPQVDCSTCPTSIARLVPQPGQNTSSHGVSAMSAARIVGDHNMSWLAASCSFQRSITAFASARAAASETCRFALMAMSRPRVRTQSSPQSSRCVWLPSACPGWFRWLSAARLFHRWVVGFRSQACRCGRLARSSHRRRGTIPHSDC
jgi:hypothetical protein